MLKELVKAVVPHSVVVSAYQWHMREKRYDSWVEAAAASADYAAPDLTAFRILRSRGIIGSEEAYIRPPARLLEAIETKTGRLVDFGGSAGEMCATLQKKLPGWSFTVIETAPMANGSRPLRPSIAYSDQLPDAFDVFYSSGTLQYLEKPEQLWRDALSRTARYAYLARNAFSDRKIYSVQVSRLFDNGAGPIPLGFKNIRVRYPKQTLSEITICQIAEDAGFALVDRIADQNTGVTGTKDDVYGADLLFKRR
ncbi:hypothetical protein NL154_05725 [Rhizobium sp. YTUHZ044]|uniref:hypothetical protein n=1 Tax=Rhizobium sp. YTUHZ044 TaxID=2962678 RepID=UPI003DA8077D